MLFAGALHVLGQGRRQVEIVEGACIAVPAHPAERVEWFCRAGMSGLRHRLADQTDTVVVGGLVTPAIFAVALTCR